MSKIETTVINDKVYRLHSTKAGGTHIGFVPVLDCQTLEDLADSGISESTIVADWKSGYAVRLQANARRTFDAKKMTTADFMRIASKLLVGNEADYEGREDVLQADVQRAYDNEADNNEANAEKVWVELI